MPDASIGWRGRAAVAVFLAFWFAFQHMTALFICWITPLEYSFAVVSAIYVVSVAFTLFAIAICSAGRDEPYDGMS